MATLLSLQCRNCEALYAVPDVYQPHIEGRMVLCPACRRSWVPIPGSRAGAPLESSKVDLRPFRRAAGPAAPAAGSASRGVPSGGVPSRPAPPGTTPPAAPQPSTTPWYEAGHGATVQVPLAAPTPNLTLRVTVSGPGANLTGIFDLGDKRFLIGRANCHLRLPKAAIPNHAIEVRAVAGGFMVSGIEGFPLMLGSITAPSAVVAPGQSVRLAIIPYSLEFQTSQTPGSPLQDLTDLPAPTLQPVGPPLPVAPSPLSSPPPRMQIQELAADVRAQPTAFGGGAASLLDQVDADMTVTDMGAMGLNAQSHNVDPLQGLDLAFVRADGPQQGQRFQITKTPLVIGRSDVGMTIKDSRVSSKHAQLDVTGPWVYTLKDLASTNGTMVNGRPVSVAHLGDGDQVSFGGVTFVFKALKRT